MKSSLQEWHSHYVTEVWDPLPEAVPTVMIEQMELFGRLRFRKGPDLICARREIDRAWAELREAVDAGLELIFLCSICRVWILDAQDWIEGPGVDSSFGAHLEAEDMLSHVRAFSIYDREKEICRRIAVGLQLWSNAIEALNLAEYVEYRRCVRGDWRMAA